MSSAARLIVPRDEPHARPRASAPPADAFAPWPMAWYALGRSDEFTGRPTGRNVFGRRVVAYRTSAGDVVAMGARCWHLGADLSAGCVIDDQVQCPFHGWRFGSDGRCMHIPAQDDVPPGASQPAYAVTERGGIVFVFPGERPAFPLPFFEDVTPNDLVGSPPLEFALDCPWWLVGTNGFDLQHFLGAHDRRLISPPRVQAPHPAARRVIAEFDVCGRSWRDHLTRALSGPRVTMDVTVWGGTLVFVAARFARTTSYGMVEIRPADDAAGTGSPRTLVRVHIFVRRRRALRAVDALDARIRRAFIRAFLQPDAELLDGAVYRPQHLIEADRVMIDYLCWLAPVSRGQLT